MTLYANDDTVPLEKNIYVLSGIEKRDNKAIRQFIKDEFSEIDNLFAYFDKCIERGDVVAFRA